MQAGARGPHAFSTLSMRPRAETQQMGVFQQPTNHAVHPLSGFTSVEESARLLRNYRYAVERMMRILGGWIALTPELSAKLLFGRHVWDNAQHADALGRRLPELRSAAHVSEPANPAFVAFMDAVEEPELPQQTVERVCGIYGVLKPHLLQSYQDHLGQANAVYEPPTQRILARCAEDERRHIHAGSLILRHLLVTPGLQERAQAWHAKLGSLLAAGGGVTGRGVPAGVLPLSVPDTTSLSDDGRELIRLEQSGVPWALPDDLHSAVLGLADALMTGDRDGVRRWLRPEAGPSDAVGAALASTLATDRRVVAFARIGRQRVVKLRLEGRGGAVTISTRWVPADGGWQAATLDLIGQDAVRPA
jgi:hypothetical protein